MGEPCGLVSSKQHASHDFLGNAHTAQALQHIKQLNPMRLVNGLLDHGSQFKGQPGTLDR